MKHLTAEQQINAEAHELAIKWLRDDDKTDMIDLTDILENQIVSVLSNGKIITSGLPQQITTNIAIEGDIEKDNEWLDNIFNTVDWPEPSAAILEHIECHYPSLAMACGIPTLKTINIMVHQIHVHFAILQERH
jgi:hypothetical protein